MSIAMDIIAVSTGDRYSVRMALESIFARRQSNGRLPYVGKPFYDIVSYTYYLHSLMGMSFLYRFSGDQKWLAEHWDQFVRGVSGLCPV